MLLPADRGGHRAAVSCIPPEQSKTKNPRRFAAGSPASKLLREAASLEHTRPHKSLHSGSSEPLRFFTAQRAPRTSRRRCSQPYLPLWGTAASCSWHESCPSSEMSPRPERKRSCCRWDNTCSCPPRWCLPACCPVHTERQGGRGWQGPLQVTSSSLRTKRRNIELWGATKTS